MIRHDVYMQINKMAVEDYELRTTILNYGIPVLLFVVMCFLLARLKKKITAWVTNKVVQGIHKKIVKQKLELFETLGDRGSPLTILEIGQGPGMNFKHYPEGSIITCLDPNEHFKSYLLKNIETLNPKIKLQEFVCGFGENLSSFSNDSFDVVVETLVLCSVADVEKVLQEVKRVLRPGGKFYFLDHVAAKQKTALRFMQDRLAPLWKLMADNCNPNRNISSHIKKAGFSEVKITEFKMDIIIPLVRPCIYGTATKLA